MQLHDLANVAGRQVDVLLLTAGANDIGFADILLNCYLTGPSCIKYWSTRLRERFDKLPGLYAGVARKLEASKVRLPSGQIVPLVAPDRVFLTQYYDPTHDPRGFSKACPDVTTPGPAVRAFGYDNVVVPLNNAVRTAAGAWNWRFVDGIAEDFHDHGSKQYRGRLRLDSSGRLWHGGYPLGPALRAVDFEADQAAQVLTDHDLVVVPIVAVHGTQVPWGKVVMDGVPVVAARRLPSMLRELPAVLAPERVVVLADQARVRFHAAF
jgi:hypothetical protein